MSRFCQWGNNTRLDSFNFILWRGLETDVAKLSEFKRHAEKEQEKLARADDPGLAEGIEEGSPSDFPGKQRDSVIV